MLIRPSALDDRASRDPLGAVLHRLRMTGTFYGLSEFTAPWGVTMPAFPDCLWFHVVTAGSCELATEGTTVTLLPGDLAVVPHGEGHITRSGPDAHCPPVVGLEHEFITGQYAILRHGGGGEPATLVCGAVRFDHPAARDLINQLPRLIHIRAHDPGLGELHALLRLMAVEAAAIRPGGEAVLTRLADILVIQAIRFWIESDPAARTGWLGALRDKQIGRAITLIHEHPDRPWTLETLAKELRMSRSAFAARFTELVNEPAMQYLARWRMHTALTTLREDGATVSELANRLGYQSEAAFSRAFKRIVGVSPGSVKRERGHQSALLGQIPTP